MFQIIIPVKKSNHSVVQDILLTKANSTQVFYYT